MSNMMGSRYQTSGYRAQANAAKRGRGGGGGMVKGRFERVAITDRALWLRFNPRTESQFYRTQQWDADTQAVKDLITRWFPFDSHYPVGRQPMQCSCGVMRDLACWPCAYTDHAWERARAEAKKLGVEVDRAAVKKSLGIDSSQRFAFDVTVMENMYAEPLLDKKTGAPRTSKRGEPILNYVPQSRMPKNYEQLGKSPMGFGRAMHTAFSYSQLTQILDLNDYYCGRHCANCASEMTLRALHVPDDEEAIIELQEPLVGDDAAEAMKDETWTIGSYTGQLVPVFSCTCGKPAQGSLESFDVRLKAKAASGESKAKVLEITKLRLPKTNNPDGTPNEEVLAMIANGLELNKIYAPTPLSDQANILGDKIKGIPSPMPLRPRNGTKVEGVPTSPYDDSESKDDADEDDADF
jgi:hypothetical protein